MERKTLSTQLCKMKSGLSLLVCCFSDICFLHLTGLLATQVNPNVTEALNAAIVAADGAYTPNRTITVYVAEARNENA